MLRSTLLRGVSAGALTLTLFSSNAVLAQQALPTIEVGAARRSAAPQRAAQPTIAPVSGPVVPVASSRPSEPKTPAEGYVVTNATTATKTDVPLKELPVDVAVVPKQVIADQAANRLQEALENVSGVHGNNNDLIGCVYKLRGFTVFDIFRNGLNTAAGGACTTIFETANLERIEVLKGPASVLYGRAEPGGLINMVTKQPLDQPRYMVEQEFGSYDHYRTQWDVTAPIKEIPGLSYRFSGAYQDEGSFRAFQGGRRLFLAPVVTYRPSAWTEFTVDMQYLGARTQGDVGFPIVGSQPSVVPTSRSFQEPNDPRDRSENYIVSYNFRQNLTEDWKVTNRFLYSDVWFDEANIQPVGLQANQHTLNRRTRFQDLKGYTYSTNIDLEGKFIALGGKHDFLMGLDYLNSYYDYVRSQGSGVFPIDLYYPVYGTVPSWAYQDAINGTFSKGHQSVLARQKGFYVQDHVTWFEKLHLLLGARYDVANAVSGVSRGQNASKELAIAARLSARDRIDTGWSPRAGVVYDITQQVSAYASYSQSFGQNNGLSTVGQTFPPQRGKQWEVGLKAEAFTGLSATLAFYQLTKSGLLTRDFSSSDPTARKPAGLQRSRGIELDVIGRVTDRLSLVANYAYTDAKVISDAWRDPLNPLGSGLLGDHLDNVPRHSGKIFATYDFGENGLGWRVGGGVTASTHVWGNVQNTFLLPGWARLDGFASYTTLWEGHKLTAQLNLRNLTGARYFDGDDIYYNATGLFAAFPAKPFTATGTVRVQF